MIAEFAFIAGILAAVLHVITGPDHLAAIAPFVIESKKKAWNIGLAWSFGHILGMALIGLLFVLFKDLIPVERISNYSEQLVGVVLIGIGLWSLYTLFNGKKSQSKIPVQSQTNGSKHNHTLGLNKEKPTSFAIGVLHGFAGIAHFLLFLPVLGFNSVSKSLLYVIGFCLGIVIAMTAFAALIGKIATLSRNETNPIFFMGIRFAGGLVAVIIGVYWILSN